MGYYKITQFPSVAFQLDHPSRVFSPVFWYTDSNISAVSHRVRTIIQMVQHFWEYCWIHSWSDADPRILLQEKSQRIDQS